MILIVGLGNPGKEFDNTPHNVGFQVLDNLQQKQGFSNWKDWPKKSRFHIFQRSNARRKIRDKSLAKVSEGRMNREKIILAKPQTFMNSSGKAVKALVKYYKVVIENLWVVHDDLDIPLLPLEKVKISKSKGSAGHKGIQSIIDEIKTLGFVRFRIGVGPDAQNTRGTLPKKPRGEKFVLKKFENAEKEKVGQKIERVVLALEMAMEKGIEQTAGIFH